MNANPTGELQISAGPSEDDLRCPPRWGTPRSPDRPTFGPRVAEVAEAMARPFMPWQQYVMDTALEVDPATGLLVYDTVVLTLPRQQGKTCGIVCLLTWRCLAWARQVVTYAAQTRDHARIKLQDDHLPMIVDSPFDDRCEAIMTNGFERIKWDNGSVWGIQATTKKSGHGPTLDMGVADEAWAQEDNRLDTAWTPAMMARSSSQFWIPSTVGEDAIKSPWFHAKTVAGREAVEAGQRSGLAYFEWSAPPDADPADPATWWECMPALGYTVTENKIRSAYASMDIKDFKRGYLNQWADEVPSPSVIDMTKWEACADPRSRRGTHLAMAVEVSIDRAYASVGVVSVRRDGRMHCEIIAHRAGTAWVVKYLTERAARHRPIGVGLDPGSPAGSLLPALARARFKTYRPTMDPVEAKGALLTLPTMREVAAASGDFYDAVEDDALRWLGPDQQAVLNRAVAGAKTRPLGDAWAWGRKGAADISPLVAITIARWVYATRAHLYDQDDYDVSASVY